MDGNRNKMRRMKRKGAIALLVLVMLTISFLDQAVDFVSDLQWFSEVGYSEVFVKQVFSKLYLGVPFFAVFFVLFYLYLRYIKLHYYKHMNIVVLIKEEKGLHRVLMLCSAGAALLFALMISSNFWMEILQFIYRTPFDIREPIFQKDISFYVFLLPLISGVSSYLMGILIFLMLATLVMYGVLLSIRPPLSTEEIVNIQGLRVKGSSLFGRIKEMAWSQIALLAVFFFLVLAIRNYLMGFSLLYSPRGATFGAGYTDIKVTLWIYRIQIVVCVVAAVAAILSQRGKKPLLLLAGPILLVAVYLVGTGIEFAVQGLIVSPNELEKERPYIAHGIEHTRQAYGLDQVDVTEFEAEDTLTYDELIQNEETIQNISLNDYRPTKEAFNQLQGLRAYYNFHDVDIDRYMMDGKLTQVFLSVRELDKTRLDENARTWINEHLKYTHGYGMTMAPVNQITSSGQPHMVIRNVPSVSEYPDLDVKVPQIYFGEMTNDYVITGSKEQEFDYPSGDSLETAEYEGRAGIRLSPMNRLLYTMAQNNFKILISGSITSESKILLHRNILERASKIAPFFSYDEDPYAVLMDGKIYYIIDGFTTSSYYPYSEPIRGEGINYIRNSIKVVVDAYNGDIAYYLSDVSDPIVQTYRKIFPGLLREMDEMPEGLRVHLRYPQKYFDVQSAMYGQYHITKPDMFYNREDKWEIAHQNYGGVIEPMESLYFTFKLPKEKQAEFVLSIPYTPNAKQNMTAFLVARNDGEHYGKLKLYKFPKNKTITGTEQVEAKISNDDKISKDLSLWNSRGSQVIRGNMLTIPIEQSLLYIEPLYIRADSENAIPEVRRIIAYYKDKVVMEDSLEKALMRLFNVSPSELTQQQQELIPQDSTPKVAGETSEADWMTESDTTKLILQANILYAEAQEALKQGSLKDYEEKIHELGKLLKQLEQLQQ